MTTYRIPVKIHKDKARSKAEVYGHEKNWGSGEWFPNPGARIVVIEAASHAEAYRVMCATVRPGDDRPIQGKTLVKFFRSEE
jgi:hypothetical protein